MNATIQSLINSADINESGGYVASIDENIIKDMLEEAKTKLEAY